MTISIYSSNGGSIKINLLEIAGNILKNFKFGETYSIDLEIGYLSIFEDYTGPELYISNSGTILDTEGDFDYDNKNHKVLNDKFSTTLYNIKVAEKLKKGLERIYCSNIKYSIEGNEILFKFSLNDSDRIGYKSRLLKLIGKIISNKNADYPLGIIEDHIEQKLLELLKGYGTNTIIIDKNNYYELTNYTKIFFEDIDNSNQDVVDIFQCDIPTQIFNLVLYSLLFQDRIDTFSDKGNNRYEIKLGMNLNSFIQEGKNNHIFLEFDEDIGILKINDYVHKCSKQQIEYLLIFFDIYEKRSDKIATYDELIGAYDFSLFENKDQSSKQKKNFYNGFTYLDSKIKLKTNINKLFLVEPSGIQLNPEYTFTIK